MKGLSAVLIATLFTTSSCRAADTVPAALSNKLMSLAGADSQDCGSVPLGNDRNPAMACARSATSGGRAYRLAMQFQGVDTLVWQGAVRNGQGKLWVLYYDSGLTGSSGAGPTLSTVQCRDIRFEIPGEDLIDCQPVSNAP
jgi:hypothetical protein